MVPAFVVLSELFIDFFACVFHTEINYTPYCKETHCKYHRKYTEHLNLKRYPRVENITKTVCYIQCTEMAKQRLAYTPMLNLIKHRHTRLYKCQNIGCDYTRKNFQCRLLRHITKIRYTQYNNSENQGPEARKHKTSV